MRKIKIKNKDLIKYSDGNALELPKYASQILNLANQIAQGTRPNVVGQMSELFEQFLNETKLPTISEWKDWYLKHQPNGIDEAVNRITYQLNKLAEAINKIDRNMVKLWVEDLVITKTYTGMYFHKAVLKKIAEIEEKDYRLATAEEEKKGIDGYVGNTSISIKPDTYDRMKRLNELLEAEVIVKYRKEKDGIVIVYEEDIK